MATRTIINTNFRLPLPSALGAIEPHGWDFLRLGWWTVKAMRFIRWVLVFELFVVVVIALAAGLALNSTVGAAVTVLLLAATMVLSHEVVFTGSWILCHLNRKKQIYLDPERRAVIVLTRKDRKQHWEIGNHVVCKVGPRYGKAFRESLATPLKQAVLDAGVSIHGQAANSRVQSLYLDQFSSWGLRAEGKKGVIWP